MEKFGRGCRKTQLQTGPILKKIPFMNEIAVTVIQHEQNASVIKTSFKDTKIVDIWHSPFETNNYYTCIIIKQSSEWCHVSGNKQRFVVS